MTVKATNIILGIIAILIIFFCFVKFMPKTKNQNFTQENIRPMAVAGQFYPANTVELAQMLSNFLQNASSSATGTAQVIIVPHAGYVYSGQVAAFAFKQLIGSDFKRVVIIGRSHQQYFEGVVADSNDAWQTAFGNVAVDKDFINQLVNNANVVRIDSKSHQTEHSLEVELPFLIKTLGKDIKIVPLLFGDDSPETALKLADVLAQFIDNETVVVVSSDLSHYPKYETANELDKKTIETILSLDIEKLHKQNTEAESAGLAGVATLACGEPAMISAMALAKKLGLKPELLKYANSGDYFPETKDRVVGYAAIAFYNPQGVVKSETDEELNKEEQKIALQITRKSLEAHFEGKEYSLAVLGLPPIFQKERGVFVTLKQHGQLRGCIGNFTPNVGLAGNIKEMALSAAFNDPRFTPLEKSELKDIKIEISVLSPMQKITNPDLIEIGKHGVYVKKGSRSGVYLPQVAFELGWNKEQFLNSLCEEKAGLPRDCWKDGSTELYIFTAQVFNE